MEDHSSRLGDHGRYPAQLTDMIDCIPNTVIDLPDERVVKQMVGDWLNIDFDPAFLRALPQFHGGEPEEPYFHDAAGDLHRIAFFLYFADDQTQLTPPLQESKAYFHNNTDARIIDRGIDYIVGCDANGFFDGDRIIPFAALFTPDNSGDLLDPRDPKTHLCLTPLDSVNCNALCFDRSTDPYSVVVFHAERSGDEQDRYLDDGVALSEIQYDTFIEVVADSFTKFTKILSRTPI